MRAEILTIGDELLRGEIIDSNKSFLAQRLLMLDIETRWNVTCADDPADMTTSFLAAASRSDILLVSGGLGPTRDDLTMAVLAETFGRELVLDQPSLDTLRDRYARSGREMPEINQKQAWFPDGADILLNPIGTAPGAMLEVPGGGDTDTTLIFCMPGVPRELYRMMDEQVSPRIADRLTITSWMRARLLRTFGLGESNLDERLRSLTLPEGVELGFRTQFPDNHVRPVARAASEAEAQARLEEACEIIRGELGALVYGEEDEPLEAATGRLLAEQGTTLAVAESCTGGLISELLTTQPGSSAWFKGGVAAYSEAAKIEWLGVPAEILAVHGAVSEQTAQAMAEGVRARLSTDLALATTGYAGPGDGGPGKPAGLVYVALAGPHGTEVKELVLTFDRERNRRITAQAGIDWIRRHILGEPMELPRLGRRS